MIRHAIAAVCLTVCLMLAPHVFPRGPHGIGLAQGGRGAKAPEARQWPALCAEWLKGIGFAK